MSRPFLLAQLSDPHIGADWGAGDPVADLTSAVESLRALGEPDAVVVSGDLTEHGSDAEYRQVRGLLAPLQAPVHVLPGNHDDRRALRGHFGLPGEDAEPVHYAVDAGPLRLVVLDTTIPGEDAGALDGAQLDWLDSELAEAAARPVVIAMHHPPLLTAVPAWDAFALRRADRDALRTLLAGHGNVRRIIAGHVHRVISVDFAGTAVLTAPSTYLQTLLNFGSQAIELAPDEPAGFVLHTLVEGEMISHVQPVK